MRVSGPGRADALLAVAVFCLVAAAVAADAAPIGRAVLAYGSAAGFGALVLVGRRWPVAAVVATAVGLVVHHLLDLPPIGVAAPAAAVLFVAAERGRARAAAVLAGVLLAVSVVARLVEGDDIAFVLGLELGAEVLLVSAAIALGDAVRSRRALRAEMERRAAAAAEERRRETARQVDAERIRIARELHDTLGHTMSVIALQAAVAEEAVADGDTAAARGAVATIRAVAGGAMTELRVTLGTLRGERGPVPGLDGLPALAERVTRSGLPVDLRVDDGGANVPALVGSTAYRVVQEALTNALRHARASRVTVAVRACGPGLALEVVDDGCGAPSGPATDRGDGLRGMTERVALLGGTVQAGEADGGGFRVRAWLPLPGGGR